jgi:hypothetical protein
MTSEYLVIQRDPVTDEIRQDRASFTGPIAAQAD